MNIRLGIGFITGAAVVISLWWILQSKEIEKKTMVSKPIQLAVALNENVNIKEPAEHKILASGKILETAKTKKPAETPITKKLPDQMPKSNVDRRTAGENPSEEKNTTVQETQNRISSVLTAHAGTDPDIPSFSLIANDLKETVGGTESIIESENIGLKKHFFWKPFSLKSKAEKFAGHISAESGVDCRVKKTEVGKYQVYYLYKDEADQAVKTALIQKTGLKL
ncbi:MAG: hypothetical protein MI892_08195 [Desulfobacterales bacterium]|nr:hypothetical protein [Desulfobacterales bacterium]